MPGLRREVLLLIGLVFVLDAVFVVLYFAASVRSASDTTKLVFTAVWTLAVLLVAVRGLSRIRSARLRKSLD
jgi:chromate transport protein ChrA